jgi:hypothetical protein
MPLFEETVIVERGDLQLSLEYIGEGRDGDYDADDPHDVPLLRLGLCGRGDLARDFSEEYNEDRPTDWVSLRDTSYCCQIAATHSQKNIQRAANAMIDFVVRNLPLATPKRLAEALSWANWKWVLRPLDYTLSSYWAAAWRVLYRHPGRTGGETVLYVYCAKKPTKSQLITYVREKLGERFDRQNDRFFVSLADMANLDERETISTL